MELQLSFMEAKYRSDVETLRSVTRELKAGQALSQEALSHMKHRFRRFQNQAREAREQRIVQPQIFVERVRSAKSRSRSSSLLISPWDIEWVDYPSLLQGAWQEKGKSGT